MARIYIVAGKFFRPDLKHVIDCDSSSLAVIDEFLKRMRLRGTVSSEQEQELRKFVDDEVWIGSVDNHLTWSVGGVEYRIFVRSDSVQIPKEERSPYDLEIVCYAPKLPNNEVDMENGFEVSAASFTPPWSKN